MLYDAPAHLIQLDRFKQGFEIPFAKTVVSLTLDDLKENGADDGVGEYLQQNTVLFTTIYEDTAFAQFFYILIMLVNTVINQVGAFLSGG